MSVSPGFRRRIRFAAGGAGVMLLGAAAYVSLRLDLEALREKHDRRVLDEMLSGKRDPEELARRLVSFHRGELPCAVYGEKVEISGAEVEQIRGELSASGLAAKLGDVAIALWRWGNEDEQRRHGPVEDEEILASWRQSGTLLERAVVVLAGHRLAETVRQNARAAEQRQNARAEHELRALSAEQRGALRATWERHPLALSLPGLASVMRRGQRP